MAKVVAAEQLPAELLAERSIADEWRSSAWSRLTFSWLFPLIRLGKTRPLVEQDMGENLKRDRVETYLAKFEKNLRSGTSNTIKRTIWRSFSHNEYFAVFLKICSDICSYVPPICINYIVAYAGDKDKYDDTIIFALAGAMLVAPFITGLCNHWWYHLVMLDGLHARTTIQAAVYSKTLRISNSARTRSTKDGGVSDTITNLQSTDCRQIEMCYWMWIYVWAAPLQVIVTTVLLYLQLGWTVLVGIGVLAFMFPVQKCVMKSLKRLTLAASKSSDKRIKLITEIISGVQVVKLQAWEDMFSKRVEEARAAELRKRRRIAYLQGCNTAITESATVLSTLATFIVFGLVSDEPLTAGKAFTTLALFNILRMPMFVMPYLINMIAGGLVASKRLAQFLYSEEAEPYVKVSGKDSAGAHENSVVIREATFTWSEAAPEVGAGGAEAEAGVEAGAETGAEAGDQVKGGCHCTEAFTLRVPAFALRPGTLTVVAGKVGSGKSSLLSALLGEMVLVPQPAEEGGMEASSSVEIRGSVAYCSQEPWIQNATLKDNILFGLPYDAQRYAEVIDACALEADVQVLVLALPGGDLTEIGERGINLSGGQKARVSLGRACYSGAEVVVLDDVLSAVDAHVARSITDKCLLALLRNRGKTVLLATHQTLCFPDADKFVVLESGAIAFDGTFAAAKDKPEFADMFASASAEMATGADGGEGAAATDSAVGADHAAANEIAAPSSSNKDNKSNSSSGGAKADAKTGDKSEGKSEADGKLTEAEASATGAVNLGVYGAYMRMCGVAIVAVIVAFAASLNAQQIVVNWWLSRWSMAVEDVNNDKSVHYYIRIYAALGLGACMLILCYQLISAYGGLKAAARIHDRMFRALLGAPLSFFDTTPSGRLLNLFTADMKSIDETLINLLSGSMSLLFMMLAVIGTVVAVIPMVAVLLVPLFAFYGWIQYIYRNTARELKRFDSTTQSPVFNHFAESLGGLSTIRAYRCEARMLAETKKRVDYNSRFWTKNNFVNRWLGLRLDWIGAGLVGFTALACTLAIRLGVDMDAGLVGLVLSYTATLTGMLNMGVRRFSEAELGMVAVERTRRLAKCPQESTASPLTDLSPSWPVRGAVKLSQVYLRYRPGLPQVLRAVSFEITPKMKVGVCGRTGSGKTTLAKALFRLMEVESGTIEIDGVDISRVDLPTLRRKISMIPQDPILFAGTLRYSLDPAGAITDDVLLSTLERVGMKTHVESLAGGLDTEVVEGGENLSAGQRQLLCMARALLETPKLLLMDEATSNMDNKTDDTIQSMLKLAFKDSSVLTIAHRIDTITWYDRVLVLDQGKVLEFDSPEILAKTEGSEFAALLEEYRKGKETR